MPWITRKNQEAQQKKIAALEAEVKGFYGGDNELNEYLRALSKQLQGIEMAPWLKITRDEIKNTYETCAPVMGVVNYIADNVGDVMRYLELTDAEGKPVEKHWLIDLLRRPNDRFTLRKFGKAWAVNKLLFGDAWTYVEAEEVGKDRGEAKAMYVIPSNKVAVDRGGKETLLKGVSLAAYGEPKDISTDKVFESFDYNLDDTSFFGVSKIVAAAVYLSVMQRGMNRQDTSLKNGGVANVISPAKDQMGILPQDKDNLEESFNDAKNKAGSTKVVRAAIDVHQLGNTPVDLNILASHKEAVTALCFVYKLPVDLYYGQSKYENAKEAKKAIYEQNAIALANEFGEDLLHFAKLDEQGYKLEVNEDRIAVLKEDPADTLDNLNKMHATLNEMRESYGYERIEEPYADQPILPMGIQFGNEMDDINETANG